MSVCFFTATCCFHFCDFSAKITKTSNLCIEFWTIANSPLPGPKGSPTPEDELHGLSPPCLSFPFTGGGQCTGGARAGVTSTGAAIVIFADRRDRCIKSLISGMSDIGD